MSAVQQFVWDTRKPSRDEVRCLIMAKKHLLAFFESFESIKDRFASEAARTQLQEVVFPILLNAIDGFLTNETSLISRSDETNTFLESTRVDIRFLGNLMEALKHLEYLNEEVATDEATFAPFTAGERLIEALGKTKAELLDHSRPLDVHIWSEHPEVNTFVDAIYANYFSTKKAEIKKKHLKLVLLDLYVAWSGDPSWKISVSRNGNAYLGISRYNELHITRQTISVVDQLEEAGLIRQAPGFFDHVKQVGRETRIWPTGRLTRMFNAARFGPFDMGYREDREVIILNKPDPQKARGHIEIDYEETPETERMRKVVRDYNDLLHTTFVDIPTLKDGFIELEGSRRGSPRIAVNQTDKLTRRIFNRGSFEKGGRFFGGWWQRCPKIWRQSIFLNDQPTHELDYSGLHIVLLYANAGVDYWGEINADRTRSTLSILRNYHSPLEIFVSASC